MPLVPLPPPDAVVAVTRLDDSHCQIEVLNPGEAGLYRFMLVLFWAGMVAISDPTLINPPPEHNVPDEAGAWTRVKRRLLGGPLEQLGRPLEPGRLPRVVKAGPLHISRDQL